MGLHTPIVNAVSVNNGFRAVEGDAHPLSGCATLEYPGGSFFGARAPELRDSIGRLATAGGDLPFLPREPHGTVLPRRYSGRINNTSQLG